MSGFDWETIERVTGGRWVVEPRGDQLAPVGAAIDTRALHRGQVFVAYVGERVDGHMYLQQAMDLGAGMCLVTDGSKVPDGFGVPTLVVGDATEALTAMAVEWRSMLRGRVIGVTGSNGKTTTTRLIYAVLNQYGKAWVSSKSHNNAIGVPMSVLNAPLGAEYVVFELGTSSPGEIGARARLVRPDIAVITSIGRAHLEELGSIEGVRTEKASILGSTKTLGIVPGGVMDEAIESCSPSCSIERVGEDRLDDVVAGERGVSFGLDGYEFVVPFPGVHNASNAAMAVLVGRACGVGDDEIAAGLLKATLPEMRLSRVEIPTRGASIVVWNDAYNANPDSTRAALSFFGSIESDANKIVILGDMLELGSAADAEHAKLVADLDMSVWGVGRIVLVGPHYAKVGGEGVECYAATDAHAMTEIGRTIGPGDLVLIKGSRGVGLERLVSILISRHAAKADAGRGRSVKDTNDS